MRGARGRRIRLRAMGESKPIPVRLSDEVIKRLDAVAKKSGLESRTAVIKLCLSAFLDSYEADGAAALPREWKKLLRDTDGRSHRYSLVAEVNGHNNEIHVSAPAPVAYKIKRKRKRKA